MQRFVLKKFLRSGNFTFLLLCLMSQDDFKKPGSFAQANEFVFEDSSEEFA